MKTRCPGCQTTFRVTPEQLKARAGKVRVVEQCQSVFNALDSLAEASLSLNQPAPPTKPPAVPIRETPETPLTSPNAPAFLQKLPEFERIGALVLPAESVAEGA